MEIAASELAGLGAYKLLTGCVVPRPIAWITSVSGAGVVNLAPFSCYTIACTDPPMLGVSIGPRGKGLKDTSRNILESREFVVNIATAEQVELVHASSAEAEPGVSEAEALGLELLPSTVIRTPRLAISPIQLECRYDRHLVMNDHGDLFIFGEVLRFHVRDDLIADGKIRTDTLSPLARLAGPNYASLGPTITMAPAKLPGVTRLS